MDATVNIPFAGKYILGGKLSGLNSYRGVADPVEVLNFDKKAVVLSDNGGEINTISFKPSNSRVLVYEEKEVNKRINEIKEEKMDYERLFSENEINQLPIKRLLFQASKNAISKSECDEDYFFCIRLPSKEYAVINSNKNSSSLISFVAESYQLPTPRSEIFVDPRYLFGLLTHVYHWNNAEVGSQYNTRRIPNVLNRKAQSFLNYLVS